MPSEPSRDRAWPADQIERWSIDRPLPYARNARRHRAAQVAEIAASIREWGWTIPVLIDEGGEVIAGHGRILAARQLAITDIPVIIARGWSDEQKRAYRLADNELALHATWNKDLLQVELTELRDKAVDLTLMGFAAEDALLRNEGGSTLPQALQLEPAREYAVIMCSTRDEWERLKVALKLTPVRRGGYRKGSQFDDIGTQRVVHAADLLRMLEVAPEMVEC